MRAKAVAALAAITISVLAGCSSSVDREPRDDGQCYQERTKSFLGIEYGKQGNIVNC